MKTITLIFQTYTTIRVDGTAVTRVPDDYCTHLFERGYTVHLVDQAEKIVEAM